MAKHIHIFLHPARTRDADPQGIKRDADGKFATTGSAGGNVEHHKAKAAFHLAESKKHPDHSPANEAHRSAAGYHAHAAQHLAEAERTHSQGSKASGGFAENFAKSHAYHAKEAQSGATMAAKKANEAARHESGPKKPATSPQVTKTENGEATFANGEKRKVPTTAELKAKLALKKPA